MRKWLFMLAAAGLGLAACDIETSGNGELDGFWRLQRVDSVGSGVTTDYAGRDIYWSFQHRLVQLSNLHDNSIVCTFADEDGSLLLDNPCVFDRTDGDTPVTDVAALRPYGVNALQERFRIVGLDADRLTLESVLLRLHFQKY